MTEPFIVFGLPRSRTFWLSRFLTYGGWACGHDEVRHARSLEDVRAYFSQPCVGSVETAGAPFWRLLRAMRPDIRMVSVRRPVAEVVDSLARTGIPFERERMTAHMVRLDRKLDQIEARVPGVLSVRFADLRSEETCRRVFEFCLGLPWDARWWRTLDAINLQLNMAIVVRHYETFRPQLDKLAKIAKQQTLALLSKTKRAPDLNGLTIQRESMEVFFRDAQPLFRAHAAAVGRLPDGFWNINLPLWEVLESAGALQIITARCNGRMFGYVVGIISPSLERVGGTVATNTLFFASPDFPGLGRRLQRASIAAFQERGVDEIILRDREGRSLAPLYRRLGAELESHLYLLRAA